MKQLLLICAVVALVGGCGGKKTEPKPEPLTEEESAKIIDKEIRGDLGKPTGELTKADLEKVTKLNFTKTQLTDVKGLEKLTRLTGLWIRGNPAIPKAQVDELKKALPNCEIKWP